MKKSVEKIAQLEFDESQFKHEFWETTTYEVLFAKHRTNYIKTVQKFIAKALKNKKIDFEVDLDESKLIVKTNSATRDPYIIVKAYELIQLISKGMLLEDCVSVLEDGVSSEIIHTNVLVQNFDAHENRRRRLSNPRILKALGLVSNTKVSVGTKAVCVVGDHRGIDVVQRVVLQCFKNIHPAYEIKELLIKKNLMNENVDGDWDRFLPKMKKGKESKKKSISSKNKLIE